MGKNKPGSPPASELSKTSSDYTKTLTKWLAVFAEHYSKEISSVNAAIYEAGLADLSAGALERACTKCLRECRFIPLVADVLERAGKHALQLGECDREWMLLLENFESLEPETGLIGGHCRLDWDCYEPGKPMSVIPIEQQRLSDAALYALRGIGGLGALNGTADKHLPLLQKSFQEFYGRHNDLVAAGMLTDGKAKKLLGKVKEFAKLGDGQEQND